MTLNHPDRLFPSDTFTRGLARELFGNIEGLPIISPHGHCDPIWFSENKRFPDPAQLFVVPDHYVFRMLVSQGLTLNELGVQTLDGSVFENDPQKIWKKFSENYHLFRGTPTAMWLDYSFEKVFGITELLTSATSDFYYSQIEKKLSQPEYLPRALFYQFNI
jgi:glucuronate isomerase